MLRRPVRLGIGFLGALLGTGLCALVFNVLEQFGVDPYARIHSALYIGIFIIAAVGGFLLLFSQSNRIIQRFFKITKWVETQFSQYTLGEMILAIVGLIAGLFIAYLLTPLILSIPYSWLSIPLTVFMYVFLGYIGFRLAFRRREEATTLGSFFSTRAGKGGVAGSRPKVLDTSAIIDGRILDIAKTGFLEGPLIVPEFVLQELRHIADSADGLKRNRGRRGLDILAQMQKELEGIEVIVDATDFDDVVEVDEKLLRLAKAKKGVVMTVDFNLNKVAGVQGVDVLNVNELANAIKPVMLPGEVIQVEIVREGKEAGQGVGYLEDGTMIVVDHARNLVGQTVTATVTSALQTAAGRMIFARLGSE